jgi:glycosyltransferase involved in cell wall biosynthesis
MNDTLPLVTIGIPTYNRPGGLKTAVESILSQTYPNLEIIISDNCSTDPEVERLCTIFKNNNKQITYYRQPVNIGPVPNFEYVLQKATGMYFNWVADDDWIDANYIERCVEALKSDQELVLVSGTVKYYDINGVYICTEKMFDVIENTPAGRLKTYYRKVTDNSLFFGLYKTAIVKQARFRNVLGDDWIFLADILCLGKGKSLPDVFYNRSILGVSRNKKALAKMFGMNKLQSLFIRHYALSAVIKKLYTSKIINAHLKYLDKFLVVFNIAVIIYKRYAIEDYYDILKKMKPRSVK